MSMDYRVRYKKGETEIEIQSQDKAYVNAMLEKLLIMTPRHHDSSAGEQKAAQARHKPRAKTAIENTEQAQETGVDAAVVANKINESDKHKQIEQHILNKTNQLAKVLLAFHFAHECGYDQMTSGDAEKITDQLGVKVLQSNISHCISDNRKYFSAGASRRRGAKIPYKLNRQGEQAYLAVLANGTVRAISIKK